MARLDGAVALMKPAPPEQPATCKPAPPKRLPPAPPSLQPFWVLSTRWPSSAPVQDAQPTPTPVGEPDPNHDSPPGVPSYPPGRFGALPAPNLNFFGFA